MKTFAIITTRANKVMAPIHDRMPVILPPHTESAWLTEETPQSKLLEALEPPGEKLLRAYEVSPAVNSARLDSKELIAAV